MTNEIIPRKTIAIPGPQGKGGTIKSATAKGTAAGSQPTVKLGGTPEERTIEFGIPKGDKGDKGDNGDKGDPGNGSVNSVQGKFGPDVTLTPKEVGGATTPTVNTLALRTTGGRLPGIAEPVDPGDAVNKGVIDKLRNDLAADLAQMGKDYLQMQDMVTAIRIGTAPAGGVELGGPFEFSILTPSQEVEVTGCYLVFDNDQALPASTTKSINWRLFHRASTSASALDIVQKATSADGMTVRRKVWDMTNGTWGTAANRKVPKGNVISLLPTDFKGDAKVLFPFLVVLHWRPVR